MEKNLARGGLHTCKFFVSDASPTAQKHQIAAKERLLINVQLNVAKFTKMVVDCRTWIRDIDIVHTNESNLRHAKVAAANTLTAWVNTNPKRLSFVCDVTLSNTLAANPTFLYFVLIWRSTGLTSERYATLGTLESNCVKEKCGCLGSFRKHL